MVATAARLETATELHERLLGAMGCKRQADHDCARLLFAMNERQLFRELGFISIAEYAEKTHDLRRSKTRGLLVLAEAMHRLPELSVAVTSGVIGWTKGREVARVATADTVGDWLEHASHVCSRDLEQVVAHAFVGDTVEAAEARRDAADPLRTLVFRGLSSDQADIVERLLTLLQVQSGLSADDFSRGDALVTMAQRLLVEAPEADPQTAPRFQRVVHVCASCNDTTGETGLPDDTDALMSDCDAETIDLTEGPTRGHLRRTIPPAVRRAVEHRDLHTCVVPGCTNRLWLDVHHLKPRSQGGQHTEDNLVLLCSSHHRLLHDGCMALVRTRSGIRASFGSS